MPERDPFFNEYVRKRVHAKVTQAYKIYGIKSYADCARKLGIFPLMADDLKYCRLFQATEA